jgi:hypothetical protein
MQENFEQSVFTELIPYTADRILFLRDTIDLIFKDDVSIEQLLDFYRIFGEMTSKISIWGIQANTSIRHLSGLLNYCLDSISSGYEILLIEGCDVNNVRIVSDVDGLMRKSLVLTAFDYKTTITDSYHTTTDEKKQSILSSLPFDHESRVVTGPSREFLFELNLVLPDVSCEFDKEFDNVDKIIDWMGSKTKDDIAIYLNNLSTSISEIESDLKTAKLTKQEVGRYLQSLKLVVSENTPYSSVEFNRIRGNIPSLMGEELCGDYYEEMGSYETKYLSPIPLIIGSSKKKNEPVKDRARLIIDKSENSTVFLKYLSDDVDTVLIDSSYSDCLDYDLYEGRVLKRLLRDGKRLNAFSITMTTTEMYSNNYGNGSVLSHVELEERLVDSKSFLDGVSYDRSINDKIVESLIEEIMPNVEERVNSRGKPNTKKYILEQMRKTHKEISDKKISHLMSIHQEVAQSILMSSKVAKSRKGHSVFFSNISDRCAISFNTLTFSTSELNDTACCIHGCLQSDNGFLIKNLRTCMSTDWFNMSPPMLNWMSTVYMKYLSYSSQYFETSLANTAKPTSTYEIAMIMLINRSGFSQASECIRYLFVNSTGVKKSMRGLFKSFEFHKDGFYKPSSHIEKLIFLRAIKTFSCVKLLSNSNLKAEMLTNYTTRTETRTQLGTERFSNWNIAFPHEQNSIPSEQNVYNSLYICRLLTMERNNKLLDETLVLRKSLDAHERFLSEKDRILRQSANNEIVDFDVEIMNLEVDGYGLYKPNIMVVALSVLNSELNREGSFSEVIRKKYDMDSSIFRLNIAEVMNNKGSTSAKGGFIQRSEHDGKKISGNQSSKCYVTTMENMEAFMTSSSSMNYYEPKTLLSMPTSLMPILLYNSKNNYPFVARMFPKGEIGPREIAILNSPMRISSYFIESIARLQRAVEHKNLDSTNLIERKDKDSIVKIMHKKFTAERGYFFDNADCSKWGPSQLSYVLYLVLGSRMSNPVLRMILRHQLKLFTKKMIKFPDGLIRIIEKVGSPNNQVTKMINYLNDRSSPIDHENRVMHSPEGMFQGVLGNTSSILASDCLRLSTSLIKILHKSEYSSEIMIESHATSDDVVRAISFNPEKLSATLAMKIDDTYINTVSGLCGIKRNEYKSTYSQHVCEFNSIFLTKGGEYNADVKSRLSFVEYSQNYDILEATVRCETQATEYLRREGSLLGSFWVDILNKSLYLQQFQLVELFLSDRKRLFKLPLEIGGLTKIDPLSCSLDPVSDVRCSNYSLVSSMPNVTSIISETEKYEEYNIDLDVTLSKSTLYNKHKKRSARSLGLSKFLSELPESCFLPVLNGVRSPISFLLANDQREQSSVDRKENGLRFSQVQCPLASEVFRIRPGPYKTWLIKNVGEKDHYSRMDINTMRTSDSVNLEKYLDPISASHIRDMSVKGRLQTYLENVYIDSIVPLARRLETRRHSCNFMTHEGKTHMKNEFLSKILPRVLGGTSDMPLRLYAMNKIMVLGKIDKVTSKKQKFKLSNIPNDDTEDIVDAIIKSNLIEGAKAQYYTERGPDNMSADPTNYFIRCLNTRILRYNPSSSHTSDLFHDDSRQSSSVDITSIISYINNNWAHHDPSERKLLIMSLLNFQSKTKHKLVVNMELLSKLKREVQYTIAGGRLDIYYRPELNRDDNVEWSDLIIRNGDKYKHIVSVFGDTMRSGDTKSDEYEYHTERTGVVRIVNSRGITFLKSINPDDRTKGPILQPLYSGEILESKIVTLQCSDTEVLISNTDKIRLQDMSSEYSTKTEFRMMKPYNDQIESETIEKSEYKDVLLKDAFFETVEGMTDHDIPEELFNDIDVFADELKEPGKDPGTEGSESEDEWADQYEEPDEYFPDMHSITSSYTSNSVKRVYTSLAGQTMVKILLPKSLKDRYVTDSKAGFTSVSQLLNDISSLDDEFDKFWSLTTIVQMITERNFGQY